MVLTEHDMRDLVMVLAWLQDDRLLRPADVAATPAWQAARRLAEKVGGRAYERFIAMEQPHAHPPRCPVHGLVMCEQFDDVPINEHATLATPNGKYVCYACHPVTS